MISVCCLLRYKFSKGSANKIIVVIVDRLILNLLMRQTENLNCILLSEFISIVIKAVIIFNVLPWWYDISILLPCRL